MTVTFNLTLGSLVGTYRLNRGLSQKDLAVLLGISAQYLNDIEHDRREPTGDKLLCSIAEHLVVSTDIVYFAAGRLPPSIVSIPSSPERIIEAFQAMRDVLDR